MYAKLNATYKSVSNEYAKAQSNIRGLLKAEDFYRGRM